VVLLWRAAAHTGYLVTSGPTRGAARMHELKWVSAASAGARRIVVRLPAGHRWIGLRAVKGSTTSRIVARRVR